ncbi:MAG: 3-oxoacyl-ACP synthase [Tannerella sp.]|jgi:3-oxoacyl-[acyl-carrier-protein] synthase-1|nr:3-oxoacyl-ACP synthase [Tannerella sp.]
MTAIIADNIVSGLGFTTAENFSYVKEGRSALRLFTDRFGLQEPFMASEIDEERLEVAFEKVCDDFPDFNAGAFEGNISRSQSNSRSTVKNYSKMEKACIVSVWDAVRKRREVLTGETVFVFSTTKGNIFRLDDAVNKDFEHDKVSLSKSAERISSFFNLRSTPITVSTACISGASALLAAQRELRSRCNDFAIVVGADMLSKFIVSGFQSFRALSAEMCRPFDAGRSGLNIGEAVATIILKEKRRTRFNDAPSDLVTGDIILDCGAVRNDANHISGPSRTGEGSYLALREVLGDIRMEEIAFVNAHGTATPYNDEMEAVALTRAGLQDVPVNSLKGYYGHTLGAAGILESIISVQAFREEMILPTMGYETHGVELPLNVVAQTEACRKPYFIKMLSGFGGCNVALRFSKYVKGHRESTEQRDARKSRQLISYVKSCCRIRNGEVRLDGKKIFGSTESATESPTEGSTESTPLEFLTAIYEHLGIDYRKFFKMDMLSKLGFLASELVLRNIDRDSPKHDMAIALFNTHSSLEADSNFVRTVKDADNYFPSPSEFVYTLPNIVIGEIALRNKIHGETVFYCSRSLAYINIPDIAGNLINFVGMNRVLTGWVDVDPINNNIDCLMLLVETGKEAANKAAVVAKARKKTVAAVDKEAEKPEDFFLRKGQRIQLTTSNIRSLYFEK